jgi:cytochrome o ubiquinol oxidase operon protein cyoD
MMVLDVLLVVVTLGLASWYRASRCQDCTDQLLTDRLSAGASVMDHSTEYRSELRNYIRGFALAVALTILPFSFVIWHGAPRSTILWIIAGTAVTQIAVHFRFFLHINLSKSKRDDLQLILFSMLIVALMAGGTIWILGDLRARMM